jgi:hypothetical protein
MGTPEPEPFRREPRQQEPADGGSVPGKEHIHSRVSIRSTEGLGLSTHYHLTRLKNDALGLIEENGRIRVSLPRLLDSFEENMVEMVLFYCSVVQLHELTHWAEGRKYADDDTGHNEIWNALLGGL